MATNKLLLVFLVLINTFRATEGGASYLGCYNETQKTRVYDINPGDFDPEAMTPDLCASRCGAYKKAYAALTYGRFCFCGDTAPVAASVPNNPNCQEVCSGDSSSKCGGKGHVSLYSASLPITGLTITNDAVGIIAVDTAVNFDVGVTGGNEVYYRMDYDDGAELSDRNATAFETRSYSVPGTYVVRVEANDFNDTLAVQKAVTSVTVQAPAADVDLECDPVLATYQEGKCVATVWQGSSLTLTAAVVAPVSLTTTFATIADPVLSEVGPGVPVKDATPTLLTPGHTGTVVALGSLVENPGRVIGWHLNAQATGTFKVLVLSPVCGGQYCPKDNNCAASCGGPAGVYSATCTAGNEFCPRTRLCDDSTCAEPARFDAATPTVPTYTVKAVVDVTAMTPGYQFINEVSLVDVSAGDVLGLDVASAVGGAALYSVNCPLAKRDFTQAGASALGATITTSGLTPSTNADCIALQATVSEGSKVLLPYTINDEGQYGITVTVMNTNTALFSSATIQNTSLLNVVEGVNFTIIDGPIYVKTNVATAFAVAPHTGIGAAYTWDMGDGSTVTPNTTDQTKTYTYTSKGSYNITATTVNQVSVKTNTSLIFVQDEVAGLAVTYVTTIPSGTAAVNEPFTFTVTLTGGSDYTCTWDFGDGTAPETTDATVTTVGAPTTKDHTYTTIGDKAFSLNCSNDVNSETVTKTQKVQERITGVALTNIGQDATLDWILPWQVAGGSDIVWNLTMTPGGASVDIDPLQTNADAKTWKSVSKGVLASNIFTIDIIATNDINTVTVSLPYESTIAIAGFTVTASTDNTTTGQNVVYTASMTAGSNVNITLDYKDGTTPVSHYFTSDWLTDQTFTKVFQNGGRFPVEITAFNPAGPHTQTLSVLVLVGVNAIQLIAPTFALYAPPSYIDVWFEVGAGQATPTEPKFTLDFNYVSPPLSGDLELNKKYTDRFDDMGVYNIIATVSNIMDSKSWNHALHIIDLLEVPKIETEFPKAPHNQPYDVYFILFRGPKAPYCNITWDFGNAAATPPTIVTNRQGEGMNGKDTQSVTHTTKGTYTITVTAVTPLETTTTNIAVEVVDPVLAANLAISPANTGGVWDFTDLVTINLVVNNPQPYSPSVTIDWGDGGLPVTTAGISPSYTHTYTVDGQMVITFTVHNDASSVTTTIPTGVWKPFTSATPGVIKCFTPDLPVGAPCQAGLDPGTDPDLFSNDKDIQFTIMTTNNAKASYYAVVATNTGGGDVIVCNKTTNPFNLGFTSSGDWSVAVTAINPLYNYVFNTNVKIVQKVVNFTVSHDLSQKSGGAPKTFTAHFNFKGTKTCIKVNFGDGNIKLYTDNQLDCPADPDYAALTPAGPFPNSTFRHTYLSTGTYTMTATAKNDISESVYVMQLEITDLDCSQPQVEIYNASINFKSPHIFTKGEPIIVRGIPIIACNSFVNTKNWTVEHVDALWGTVTGDVDLAAKGVVLNTAELSLNRWALEYGLYKVTFSMSMISSDPNLLFKTTAYSYIEIVKSHLIGLLVEGGTSEIVRGTSSQSLLLNPMTYSYDPDVVDKIPANSNLQVLNWTCHFKNGSAAAQCPAIQATTTTGSTGALSFPAMSTLLPGETYTINVTMSDTPVTPTRFSVASVKVKIVTGDPPHITIRCTAGSICHQMQNGFRVLQTARLGLSAECANCLDSDVLTYKWNISMGNSFRWPDGWRPLQPIDIGFNRTVGVTSQQMSIEPALFEHFKQFNQLRAECVVTRGGAVGSAATEIEINEPPTPGNCTIYPKAMNVSREKLFRIVCEGWVDNTGIEEYQFFSFFDPESVRSQITVVMTPQGHVDLNVTLAQGAHYLAYNNTVMVAVRDSMGATTEYIIDTVQVFPVDSSEVRSVTANILNNPNSDLSKMLAEGDVISIIEFATTIAAMLNSDKFAGNAISSTATATSLGPVDRDRVGGYTEATVEMTVQEEYAIDTLRDNRAQVRVKLLESLVGMPNNTMLGRSQLMSAMASALTYPDEVPGDAQLTVIDAILSFSEKLSDGEEVTPEQRETNMKYMFAAIGSTMDAAATTGFDGTKTELAAAAKTDRFKDYPTENVAADDDCVENSQPANWDEAYKQQSRLVNCVFQRERSIEIEMKVNQAQEMILKSFNNSVVPGASKQFNTERMRITMAKKSAGNVFGTPQKMEYTTASVVFPPSMNDIFASSTAMNENTTILSKMAVISNYPIRYSKSAKNIPTTTRMVAMDIYGEDGNRIPITGMPEPIIIEIPRAPDTPPLAAKNVDPKMVSWNKFQLHKTETTYAGASLHATICPSNPAVQYAVVFSKGEIPDPANGTCTKAFLVPANMSDPVKPACTSLFLDNEVIDNYIGPVYVGVRQLLANETDLDVSNCTQLPDWQNGTGGTQFTGNYTIKLFGSACFAINTGDSDWSTNGCVVNEKTDDSKTVCACTHLTTFAGGFVVVPNTIDWNYVFNNFDFAKNPTLYITEIVIIVVYIIAFIWARRKDKKDVEKLGIAPLVDNDPKDKYYYEIVVVTGMRRNAGTESKVYFIMSGEDDETDVREFSDTKRKIFKRGDTNGFLMATPRPLGYLNYARIWHDNSGKGSQGGWYLNYLIVRDVQTDEKWVFIADKWFAVEESDGQVDRIVPVATRDSMTNFSHMFAERSRKNLADGHLWFSVVARPPQSRFTCLQRVSCCLLLLYTSMLANAMFYRTDTESEGVNNGISFGPFSVSAEQISIGVISNLIIFPVSFIVITLFRKARPRKLRPSRVDEAIKVAHDGPRTDASVADVKPEVSSIFSVSRPTSMMTNPKPRPESAMSRPGTSLSTRADGTLPIKKKKAKSYPWWCRIVGWVVLWVATLLSMAFTTFYGISFADETCKKWISSMLISFFMSVFITQPIKVFVMAILLSLIIKNPGNEEEEEDTQDEEITKLANDEIPLHNLNGDTFGATRPRKIGYKPPDRKELDSAREQRLKEIQMWSIIREVIIYSFFLWILLVIAYRQSNSSTFLYKDTMERVYIKNNESDIDFMKIRNAEEYWTWTRSGLVNGIRAGAYYNDFPPLMLRGFVNDKVSKILGWATMRQVRIRPSLCEMDERMLTVVRECNVGYSIGDQEEGTFDRAWTPRTENSTSNDTDAWYTYTKADQVDGYPYWGELSVYAGGGYMVPLKGGKSDLIALMTKLQEQNWIDRYTRAVFVEFTTYNAQVNLFGIATILAEFHPTGGAVQGYRFEPAMLLPYMTQAMFFQLACEGFFLFFILFFMFRLVKALIKEKFAFFKGFWNLVEMGIISMSIGAVVIYFYRLFETNKLTSRFKESNGMDYIKFQYVAYWNEIFTYMIGWTVFFATLKFMRLLRFNKRMSLLASTLRAGAKSLIHFSVIFWIVFLAFSMLFFLSFMTIDIKYSSFIGSVVSGILMMMGKFDIYKLTMAEPVLTQIFVFLFVLSVTFIIVNMFVSILNETFGAVREDINKQSNDYEIVAFMVDRFKRFTGMGASQANTLTPEEQRNQEQEQRYAEGRGNSCVDDFPDRIDRLLHSISNVYMDQDQLNAMMDKKGYQGGKGCDNPAFNGPKGRVSEMSKVHTH